MSTVVSTRCDVSDHYVSFNAVSLLSCFKDLSVWPTKISLLSAVLKCGHREDTWERLNNINSYKQRRGPHSSSTTSTARGSVRWKHTLEWLTLQAALHLQLICFTLLLCSSSSRQENVQTLTMFVPLCRQYVVAHVWAHMDSFSLYKWSSSLTHPPPWP